MTVQGETVSNETFGIAFLVLSRGRDAGMIICVKIICIKTF